MCVYVYERERERKDSFMCHCCLKGREASGSDAKEFVRRQSVLDAPSSKWLHQHTLACGMNCGLNSVSNQFFAITHADALKLYL